MSLNYSSTMAEIPENLIFEILLLLPMWCLARFRRVSKRWRDLIDSPDLTKSRSNICADRPLMIFTAKSYPYLVELDSICNDLPPPILQELPLPPWKGVSDYYSDVGTCNGLICLRDIDYYGFIIWNPSTDKHIRFQLPEDPDPDSVSFLSFGFGYDSGSDDYKVVSIALPLMVWIYSVKSGLLMELPDLPQSLLPQQEQEQEQGVFFGGALHWIVESDAGDVNQVRSIVGLDMEKLTYKVSSLPAECRRRSILSRRISLAAIDGCLCLTRVRSSGLDLWVMKEYECWTVMMCVRDNVYSLDDRFTPFAFADNGNAVLFVTRSNEIVRYQRGTASTSFERLVHYWSTLELGRPMVYLPSFAWPQLL